jgi:succinate dehydrogenase / fumarate reductase cytochrome b subunit
MRRVLTLQQSTIGKKAVMAVTGIVLFGYVAVHMLANLKIFIGPSSIDSYAEWLREVGSPALGREYVLWAARAALLAAVALHIWAAVSLRLANRAARPVGYRKNQPVESTYASRTMFWGGALIAAFVVYHILHLTVGSVHPAFHEGRVYDNVVLGFQVWPVAVFYMLAIIALGFHLYHGVWSFFQTLGWNHPRFNEYRRGFATIFAIGVSAGFIAVPVAVLAGWLAP